MTLSHRLCAGPEPRKPVNPHRVSHILEVLLPEIFELKIDLAQNMAEDTLGEEYSARLR